MRSFRISLAISWLLATTSSSCATSTGTTGGENDVRATDPIGAAARNTSVPAASVDVLSTERWCRPSEFPVFGPFYRWTHGVRASEAFREKLSEQLIGQEGFLSDPIGVRDGSAFVAGAPGGPIMLRRIDSAGHGRFVDLRVTSTVEPIADASSTTRAALVARDDRVVACVATSTELVVVDDVGRRYASHPGRFDRCSITVVDGRLIVAGRAIASAPVAESTLVLLDVDVSNVSVATYPELTRIGAVEFVHAAEVTWLLVQAEDGFELLRIGGPTSRPEPVHLRSAPAQSPFVIERYTPGPVLVLRADERETSVPFCSVSSGRVASLATRQVPDLGAIQLDYSRDIGTLRTLESTLVDTPTLALAIARWRRLREVGAISDDLLVRLADSTRAWVEAYRRLSPDERPCPPELSSGNYCLAHQLELAIESSREALERFASSDAIVDRLRVAFGRPAGRPDLVCEASGVSDPAVLAVLRHEYELPWLVDDHATETIRCRLERGTGAVLLDRVVLSANGDVARDERAYERIDRVAAWTVVTKRDWWRTSFSLASVGGSIRVDRGSSEDPRPDILADDE